MFLSRPSSAKPRWKYLPLGLCLLVAIQLLGFALFQYNDVSYRYKATEYYFKSNLHKIEFPIYIRYLQRYLANNSSYNRFVEIADGIVPNQELYWMQRYDPLFQECLNNNECLPDNSLYAVKWQELRREYLRLLKKDSAESFAFKSTTPSLTTAFASIFMNSDVVQLLVNIVFLVIMGVMLESLLGLIGILISYLVCGMSALAFYCLLMPYSSMPVLASSGAIAGLLFITVILGSGSKLRLNYYTRHGLQHLQIASELLIPLWILVQFLLFTIGSVNAANLIPQIGGMMAGFVGGLYIKISFMKSKSTEPIIYIEAKRSDFFQQKFNEAINQISLANDEVGKAILMKLLQQYPQNREVYFQLFNLLKKSPQSKDYHHIVFKIFALHDNSKSMVAMKNQVFKHYQAFAKPSMHFDAEVFLSLLQKFRESGYWDDAEKILHILIKRVGEGIFAEELAQEQWLLAQSYLKRNNKGECDKILASLLELFPQTESAKQVRNQLR